MKWLFSTVELEIRRKNGNKQWFESAAFDFDLIAQNTQFVQTLK